MVWSEARFLDQEYACLLLHLSQPSTDVLGGGARATISAILRVGKQRPMFGQLAPVVDEALGNQLGVERTIEVAPATSSPMRSNMRRSTLGIGEGVQSSRAACTAARAPKSALSSTAGPGWRPSGLRLRRGSPAWPGFCRARPV